MREDNFEGQTNPIAISPDAQGCGAAIGVVRLSRWAMVWRRWIFFSCISFLSPWPWFSCQTFKFSCVLDFVFVLSYVLVLLISICFDFNSSWTLCFSISSLSTFNWICFLYPIRSLFFWLPFFYPLHLFYFFDFVLYNFNSFFFKFWSLFFFITLFSILFFIYSIFNLIPD